MKILAFLTLLIFSLFNNALADSFHYSFDLKNRVFTLFDASITEEQPSHSPGGSYPKGLIIQAHMEGYSDDNKANDLYVSEIPDDFSCRDIKHVQDYVNSIVPLQAKIAINSDFDDNSVDNAAYILIYCYEHDNFDPGWTYYQLSGGIRTATPASCTVTANPAVIEWSLASTATGDTKQSEINISCDREVSVTTDVNSSIASSGKESLGNGVSVEWVWPDGAPVSSKGNTPKNLSVTPTTIGASSGSYAGNLVIRINYN
jgi:hypothetical protein